MAEQTEPQDLTALLLEAKERGWAALVQIGDFDEFGVKGSGNEFDAFVWVPIPSAWGHHSDDDAILPDNLEWDHDIEPYCTHADTPVEALSRAMAIARTHWEWSVKDRAELRADNRESDSFSAPAGTTT